MVVGNNNAKKVIPKIRRNSTGNLDFNTSSTTPPQPLPLPNYLRASMGSCHDFCKYGGLKPKPEEFTLIRTTTTSRKPPVLPTKTTPLPKKPPVLPAKTSKLARNKSQSVMNVGKSQNVMDVVKNTTSSNVTNQQKIKQKAVIPKHPNDLKLRPLAKSGVSSSSSSVIIPVQTPSRRRYSDIYGLPPMHSIKNGRSSPKAVCVNPLAAATVSQSGKRGVSRNALKKDLAQCGNKSTINKAEIEPCCEIPVEKILYIDEVLAPCKNDHYVIQKLSSDETNDKANGFIDDGFSSSLSEDNISKCGSTTGSTCSDTLASVSITSSDESDSDISSYMYTPEKGDCEDIASMSVTSCETDSDISSNCTFESKKGNPVDDVSIPVTFKPDSDISSHTFEPTKGSQVDDVSIIVTSCETYSDISSNKFHTNKVIPVDDDFKSSETRNEPIQVVVLLHQHNQEEKTSVSDNDVLKEATRLLVEAGKVKALVSAFEAAIYLEDDMSLRTLKA